MRGEFEAEGMTTTLANKLGPFTASLVNCDEVSNHDASQRVTNHFELSLRFDEWVPASTRIFSLVWPSRNDVNSMTEESAYVVNFLSEFSGVGIQVVA